MKTTNQTGRRGRYGTKEDQSPAVPSINQDETKDAFVARAKALGCKDAEIEAAWSKANPPAQENELTVEQVQEIVTKAVQAANGKNAIDEAALRKIIGEELTKQSGDSKSLTVEQVEAAAKAASQAVADANRTERKNTRSSNTDPNDDRGPIEIPYSLRKGNLPLHYKQLLNVCLRKPMNDGVTESQLEQGKQLGDSMLARLQAKAIKALTSVDVGAGDEWVPTDLSSQLQRRLYASSDLAALMLAQEIDMPTDPYEFPLATTRVAFKLNNTQGSAQAETTPGTGKITLTTQRFGAKALFSYEAGEDAIIAILPFLQQQFGESAADAIEDAYINGDDSATHMDSDTHAAENHVAKAWKGFRKLALAGSLTVDLSTNGIDAANCRSLIKMLGIYAKNQANLLWLCGVKGGTDFMGLPEVLTADKAGARATVFTGSLASLYNIPIVGSARCREDLNASGVFDNVTKTKGNIMLINKSRFILGRRREVTIETDKDIDTQQTKLVASFRRAFVPVEVPSATITSLVLGYKFDA